MNVLEWDTEFFGIQIARADLAHEQLGDAVGAARAAGVECLYLAAPVDDPGTVTEAVQAGARLVDIRVELAANAEWDQPDAPGIRLADDSDRERVEALAAELSTVSRFSADARFPRERIAEMYRIWARGCLGDGVVALADGGFVGARPAEDATRLELVYVQEAAAGRGLGSALARAALHAVGRQHAVVVTQAGNVPALRLYEQLGFRTTAVSATLHLWLDAPS